MTSECIGTRKQEEKNNNPRLNKNIKKAGGEMSLPSISDKQIGQFWLTRHGHPDLNNRYRQKRSTDLRFPVVRLHDTYCHSLERPFGRTINKQADKHNT